MNRWLTFGCFLGMLSLNSCTRVHYEGQPLRSLSMKHKIEQKVIVLYKPLTTQESRKYLDRDWIAKGYQPVQIAIENISSDPMQFTKEGLSLPVASEEMIKTLAHRNSKIKATSIGAPSATMLTLGLIGLLAAPAAFGLILLVPIGLGSAGMHTASTLLKADTKLDQDYDIKFLHDGVIAPRSILEGVVFIPKKEFQDKFMLKVVDTKNNKIILVEAKKCKTR